MSEIKGMGLAEIFKGLEPALKQKTEAEQKSKTEEKDKIKIQETKLAEISKLQMLLRSVKTTASCLTDPLKTGFNKKVATSVTQDTGPVAEYLTNISIDDKARVGNTKIAIEQIATGAELVLSSGLNTGFDKIAPLGKTGNITLTVGGNARIVPIVPADTASMLVENMNRTFNTNADKFEAFLVEGDGNTTFIEVRAKTTGAGAIAVAYDVGGTPGPLTGGDLYTQNSKAGLDAIIYIDGIPRTQSSNKFTNIIEGLSFELAGKVNTANVGNGVPYNNLNYNTIKVKEDHSGVKDMIVNFGNALNDLSYLVAKNKQSSRSVDKENRDFLDPNKPLDSYDSDTAVLRGSAILREADNIVQRFAGVKEGASGDIKSIYDLGMIFKKEVKEGIEYEALYFKDEKGGQDFNKKFEDNFEAVRKFFITDTKITSTPGNLSKLQYVPGQLDEQITSRSVVGQDINIAIDFTAPVPTFIATVNGNQVAAEEVKANDAGTGYKAVFSKNSILAGMYFSFSPGGATSLENYTINYTPGMANLVKQDARSMFSDDAKAGSTIIEANIIQDKIKFLGENLSRIEEDAKKETAKKAQLDSQVAMMEMQHNLWMQHFNASIGTEN